MALGPRIRKRREELELQQGELADRLGVAQSTVADWENEKMNPRLDRLAAIAKALKCDVAELLG